MDVMIRLAWPGLAWPGLRCGCGGTGRPAPGVGLREIPGTRRRGVRGAFCLLVRARGVAPPELAGRDGRHGGGHDEPRPVRADGAARAWPGPVGLPRERVRPAGVP